MTDDRIQRYHKAARAMAAGAFQIAVPTGDSDEVGELGHALTDLGRALDRRFSELHALFEITGTINSGLVFEEVLNYVYDAFKELIPYDRIGCALIDTAGVTVRAAWARTDVDRQEISVGYSAPLKGSSLAEILDTGEPRILNDLEAYLEKHPASGSTRRIVREGVRSSLTCPLIADGKPVGFLFFSSREPGTYANVHAAVYKQIAAQISVIVEKGRIYQELLNTKRQLQEANEALEKLANADGLTGVANRRFFDDMFDREWHRALRQSEPLSVIMVDIDHFKEFNDRRGHQAGDDCLKQVAQALVKSASRRTDIVARYGGEEFVVVLTNTGLDAAAKRAEVMRESVHALSIPHPASSTAENVTISLGVAGGIPRKGREAGSLVGTADTGLYQAKRAGRNRVVCLDW